MPTLPEVLAVLDLEPKGDGWFRANHLEQEHDVVFGGQLLAQALVAASRAVPAKAVLSMHNVFVRAASPAAPLDVDVEVLHVGRAFASATVTMAQGGRTCTRAEVLLHEPSPDLVRHADPMPPVEAPPTTTTDAWWQVHVADGIDLGDADAVGPPELRVWSRFPGAPTETTVSQALLAYASDGFLIGTAMRPHPGIGQSMAHRTIATTVLTQTLSFHEPFDAGEWLLLDQRSTYAGRGRSRGRAEVFTAEGRLVASFGQDNMIRRPVSGSAV